VRRSARGRPTSRDRRPAGPEFGFPGELRDRLVALILAGTKTAGAGLLAEYEEDGDLVPRPGDRSVLVDSDGRGVALLETTEALVVRVGDVDQAFARDEGEGFETVAHWRAAHERFWGGYRTEPISDDTLVVCERFRLVEVFSEPR
jgi:uncharacterized protein YhfF